VDIEGLPGAGRISANSFLALVAVELAVVVEREVALLEEKQSCWKADTHTEYCKLEGCRSSS